MKYKRLVSPAGIRGLELKNRMVIPAIHTASTENGACTDRFADFYRRRALGGIGLIITGSCRFDEYGSDRLSMSLASDEMVPGWKKFTDIIHETGCPVAVQLFHAGRYVKQKNVPCGKTALSPSEGYCAFTRETTPGMTKEQIEELKEAYYLGTRRAVQAGFDAVEISGSSGYLLCQFLSPLVNRRTDRYGGSFENRCRLPLEVIRTVREAAGDLPVIYRLGADDFVDGSNRLEDLVPFAALAEKAGVDCFNVTGGWHETKVPQLTGEVPRGGLAFLSAAVKDAVSVPVIANNRINDPDTAEKILALEEADLVGVGRACIADPDFPEKVMEDRTEEIRPCIACNQGCLANVFFGKPLGCHVNSRIGKECGAGQEKDGTASFSTGSPFRRSHILVAGGGPAGCEAALRLAQRGDRVTLWEKTDSLGGQLKLAAKVPGKQEFAALIEYYRKNLAKAGVEVIFCKEFEAANAGSLSGSKGFDEVIFACGGRPKKTVLDREEGSVPVYTSAEILSGQEEAGRRVVVIGGSFIGCETARFLAEEASLSSDETYYFSVYKVRESEKIAEMLNTCCRQIWILDRGKKIGYGYEPGTAWPVLAALDRFGVKKLKETEAVRAAAKGIIIQEEGSGERLIECDTIVTAFGVDPAEELNDLYTGADVRVSVIGNARKTGRSTDAVAAGQNIV